jgi:hypothetical protein
MDSKNFEKEYGRKSYSTTKDGQYRYRWILVPSGTPGLQDLTAGFSLQQTRISTYTGQSSSTTNRVSKEKSLDLSCTADPARQPSLLFFDGKLF